MNTVDTALKHGRTSLTIDELVKRYETSNTADGKSQKTIDWYTDMLGLFSKYMKAHIYSREITDFTIDNVREYVLYLRDKPKFRGHPYTPEQDEPISAGTVQCHVRALKAFSSWLFSEGYTTENRLKNLKVPKAPVRVISPLTPEEIKKIAASINKKSLTGARNNALLSIFLDTGLRASEGAGITLNNINLADGYIKVMGKGSKERVVPIGKYVQMTLLAYIDRVRPEPSTPDCNNLFLTQGGKPITVNTVAMPPQRVPVLKLELPVF